MIALDTTFIWLASLYVGILLGQLILSIPAGVWLWQTLLRERRQAREWAENQRKWAKWESNLTPHQRAYLNWLDIAKYYRTCGVNHPKRAECPPEWQNGIAFPR